MRLAAPLQHRSSVIAASAAPQRPAMNPVEKARKQMGYKNNWNRREVSDAEQRTMKAPLRDSPSVAIIGGGLSGLACATELARLGIRSTVFDTGQHGPGGRLATRGTRDGSLKKDWVVQRVAAANLAFDHAAQFFTASDPRFQAFVDAWLKAGAARPWDGQVGTLEAGPGSGGGGGGGGPRFAPLPAGQARYVASGGMRRLAQHMQQELESKYGGLVTLKRPLWVGRMASEADTAWRLSGEGRDQGLFDFTVIAHNGKCANRLVGPVGAPRVARQLMGLRLSAVWALMVAFEGPVPAPFEGAFVQGSPVLSWAANNTAKLQLQHTMDGLQCWTLISTNAYGQANKVPQEAVPPEVQDKVAKDMLEAFAAALGLPNGVAGLPPVVFRKGQLWGAALPTNTPGQECILDPQARVGVCGDWLLGSSMQAAVVSGVALANRIAALRGVPMDEQSLAPHKAGLTAPFRPLGPATSSSGAADSGSAGGGGSEGVAEIGGFPGLRVAQAGAVAGPAQRQQRPASSGGRGGGGRGGGDRGSGRSQQGAGAGSGGAGGRAPEAVGAGARAGSARQSSARTGA